MNRLLKDLGNYSRVGRDDVVSEQLSLKVIIAECCEVLEVTNNFEFQVDDCEFELPKPLVMLIFEHLISNAIKHHHQKSGVIQITCLATTENYKFSVVDDGPGIAPEFHHKVFKPFQTLKPKDEMETSGLGLAIVKKILSIHGGSIMLDSQIGSGSVFTINWPVCKTA